MSKDVTNKVYTITCHNVYNHGASLQEYALLRYLDQLGYDSESINYRPDYLSGHFNFFSIDNPKFKKNIFLKTLYIVGKFPFKLLAYPRKLKFDSFSKKYIKETKKEYSSNKELIADFPKASNYICGSDQIWNSFFQNGKDPAFYLNFVPDDRKKTSYAPSFAIDEIDENLKKFVKNSVQRLDHISVRESSGKKILTDLGISNVTQVLDPVFLLDKKEWNNICHVKLEDNYILVYDFDNNPLLKKMAYKLKSKYNCKIIALNRNTKYADSNYFLQGPDVFISLVKHAKFVLTNSFHAVAFSILFQKDFLVFNRTAKINTRMRDLLQSLGIEERLLVSETTVDNITKPIDYEKLAFILGEMIQKSKDFLSNALSSKTYSKNH